MRNPSYQNWGKIITSLFFKQFVTPTFFQKWNKKFVKRKSKKDCWKSGNVLLKVKIKVEGSFSSRKFFFQNFFLVTYIANSTKLPERLHPMCESLSPKVQNKWQICSFFRKNICPQTKIWTGKMMLLPFLPKELSSKSDKFKINRKWMKTYLKDFDTVLRQMWENWLNPFVWSVKTFLTKMWKKLNCLFFKQFLTPIFFSRIEKRILWNACREKPLKIWKRVAQSLKKMLKAVFFPGKFSSKNFFWSRTTQIREDCRNVYVRRVEVVCPKCKEMANIQFFSEKKTFVLKQNSGLVKWCFCHS